MQEYFDILNSELDTRLASSVEWVYVCLDLPAGRDCYHDIYIKLTPQNKEPFEKLANWMKQEFKVGVKISYNLPMYIKRSLNNGNTLTPNDDFESAYDITSCIFIRGDLVVTDELLNNNINWIKIKDPDSFLDFVPSGDISVKIYW